MKPPRPPTEQMAGCCWLPRFTDKTRGLLRGDLSFTYRMAYGSRLGVDGYFLRHFQIARGDFIRAVRAATDDNAVVAWFLAQPGVTREAIASWNQLAPQLGSPGHPAGFAFRLVSPFFYPNDRGNPSKSIFEAVEKDEA